MHTQHHSHSTLAPRPLARRRPGGTQGGTLILALLAVGTLLLISANVMRVSSSRLATVAQAGSWQKAYYLAESGVDIARNALRAAQDDSTIWATQTFPQTGGGSTGWVPNDATTFPKVADITMPSLGDDANLLSTVRVEIDIPSGGGTINPTGTSAAARCFRVRSLGSTELPGAMNVSHDPVEVNLRKVGWKRDWRTGETLSPGSTRPRASRMLEVVLAPQSPFLMAILANEKIEIKKGSGKLVDSWNSKDPDSGQRKYLAPDKDKWKGARDVGNIGANGINSKDKLVKDAIRLEGAVIWGDVYAAMASQVKIKPTPAKLTDVIKGGDIIDGFYMKLDPVAPAAANPYWSTVSSIYTVDQNSLSAGPLFINASADPNAPTKIKFDKLHMHELDTIIIKPAVNVGGVVQPASYVDIWVAGSMRIHKGGKILLGNGVYANIYVDKCIHVESQNKLGGIQYANFALDGAGKIKSDAAGNPQYTLTTVAQAVANEFADASQLAIYGALARNKRSHARISAETLGTFYAPGHDFKMKFKDNTYMNLYGSYVGRKFKIEGKTQVHYDENLRNAGAVTDYQVVSVSEDWYDRSGGK